MSFRLLVASLVAVVLIAPVQATPVRWNVDPAKSSLRYEVVVGGQKVGGQFKAFGALITFCTDDLANSSAKITIDMTESKSGDATRDAMLLKPAWFNVLDFPQAVYQTTAFLAKGGDTYEARGKLTLKGVSKDVALPFTLSIKGDTAVAKGETTVQRLQFGVGSGADFATGTPVALEVKVLVNITARRAK